MNLSRSRIVVTGGAGFIGSHLSMELLDNGAEVHVLDSLEAGRASLVPEGAHLHELDVRNGAIDDVVSNIQPHAIVHLAAVHYIPECERDPAHALSVNVGGTRTLLEAAGHLPGLERLLFASSAAVYAPHAGPLEEPDPTRPIGVYGQTKLVGEELLDLFGRNTGVTTVAARLFNVYGPNETNPHLIPEIFRQLETGDTVELGNLGPARDFVHVRDVSKAMALMLSTDGIDQLTLNVGSGTARTVRDVVTAVGDALGRDLTVRQTADRARESDRPYLKADIARARKSLGWEPTIAFRDGLAALTPGEVMG